MKTYTSDAAIVLGVGFLIVGAAQLHPSLGWVVAGLAVSAYGLLLGLTKPSR